VNGVIERVVGAPAVFEELKHKPGRRLTVRARGPKGSVIVKLYSSDRVATWTQGSASERQPHDLYYDRADHDPQSPKQLTAPRPRRDPH
jgi:hypothetical protein